VPERGIGQCAKAEVVVPRPEEPAFVPGIAKLAQMTISFRLVRGRALASAALALFLLIPTGALAQTQEQIDRARDIEHTALDDYKEAEARHDEALTEYLLINAELEELTYKTTRLIDQIRAYESEASILKNRAETLLFESYTSNTNSTFVGLALEAGSIQDLMTAQLLLERAAEREIAELQSYTAITAEAGKLKVVLDEDRLRVAEIQNRSEELVIALDKTSELKAAALQSASTETREAISAYNKEQARLKVLEAAKKRGVAGGFPPEATPNFFCPLPGASFINDWGFPRSGGRTHQGTDIFNARNKPVIAAGSGTVRLRTGGLGGVTIYLTTDYGMRFYYAHLEGYASGLKNGDRVTGGQLIGYNGNSGNAITTPTHVHFQMQAVGGQWKNPYPTLRASC